MSNNPGFFQHHLPHNMPYIPQGTPLNQDVPPPYTGKPLVKAELKKVLKKLVQVSTDMDTAGRSMALTKDTARQNQVQEKLDKLSKEQAILLKQIVDTSKNEILKKEFVRLSTVIGDFQKKIRNSKTAAELEQVQKNMDSTVDTWINVFKDISMDAIQSSSE